MVRQNPGPTLVGNRLSFADLYSVTAVKSRLFPMIGSPVKSRSVLQSRAKGAQRARERFRNRLKADCFPADSFCHFESVTDFTRGIFGTRNRLGFWDGKNPSGSPYKYAWVPAQNYKRENLQRTTRLNPPTAPPCTLLHPVRRRAPV
jgi:hypothetical protein